MQIRFTFRNLDSSEAIKAHAQEKLDKLNKYFRGPVDVEVTLSVERHEHTVGIHLSAHGEAYDVSDVSEDMYASLDLAVDKMRTRLVRARGQHEAGRRDSGNGAVGS